MRVFCDFDGTIATTDTTDALLTQFALPEWIEVEKLWVDGVIGSHECMQRQVGMVHANLAKIDEFNKSIEIETGFKDFINFCGESSVPITVVSDGIDYIINQVLSIHGVRDIPVIANRLIPLSEYSYTLESPYTSSRCKSGVCKCDIVTGSEDIRVYIGDGRSDFCAAGEADLIFAKDALADYCEDNCIPYILFQDFNDIKCELMRVLSNLTGSAIKHAQGIAA